MGFPPQPACPADLAVVVRVSSPVNSGVDEISGIERVNVLSNGTAETGTLLTAAKGCWPSASVEPRGRRIYFMSASMQVPQDNGTSRT